jgi:hypothetical protein
MFNARRASVRLGQEDVDATVDDLAVILGH